MLPTLHTCCTPRCPTPSRIAPRCRQNITSTVTANDEPHLIQNLTAEVFQPLALELSVRLVLRADPFCARIHK